MRNQFTVLFISSLLVSACFATTYPSATYTTNCTSPQLHLSAVPSVACTAAAACTTGYSDNAPTATTTNVAATATAAADCKYCAPSYFWDSILYDNCVLAATGGNCATGYSDVAPSGGVNQANTAAGTALTGPCTNCAPNYYYNMPSSLSGVNCVLKTDTSAGKCASGYADNSNGTASAAGSLAGNCLYCVTGYSDVAPVNSTTNSAATAAGATGACKYCAVNYVWNEPSSVSGAACVLKTDTTNGKCATGFTDSSTGAAASAAGSLAGSCMYCLTGYSDVAPVNATTNSAATAAGATGTCKYCAPGYTQTAVGGTCTATTSGSFLMVSISLMATLIMIFF